MFRYFVVGELAGTQEEVIRIAGLLRGVESAVQAVSVSCTVLYHHLSDLANNMSVRPQQCPDHCRHRRRLSELWSLGTCFVTWMVGCEGNRGELG